ncbi:MAG: hypothetical protein JJU11_18395 [Candidatus Sumerlaeia bacterium]|nr:hypothetical protein [Candidatus Sumerlaeia bacterium]
MDRDPSGGGSEYQIWRQRQHAPSPELVSATPLSSGTLTIVDVVPNSATYTYTVKAGTDESLAAPAGIYYRTTHGEEN